MRARVAILYNKPVPSRYDDSGEAKAVEGVLDSVTAVRRSLRELGHEVVSVPLTPPFEKARQRLATLKADIIFNLFEGFCGDPESEALVPELLEAKRVPFTGCGARALRLALDKAKVKVILQAAGLPTPDFQLLSPVTLHSFRLDFPCIVKPRGEDASHGINAASVVRDFASLERQVKHVSEVYGNALVEEFLTGREFNATVLGNEAATVLPPSEIVYALPPDMPRLLTFEAKWEEDSPYYRGTQVVCPAEIGLEERRRIRETALAACRLLDCRGYARVDLRMDKEGKLNIIEVNPNPDISPEAGAARQARAAGMSYTGFIERILRLALEKDEHDAQNPPHAAGRQAGAGTNIRGHARVQTV